MRCRTRRDAAPGDPPRSAGDAAAERGSLGAPAASDELVFDRRDELLQIGDAGRIDEDRADAIGSQVALQLAQRRRLAGAARTHERHVEAMPQRADECAPRRRARRIGASGSES